MQKTGEPLPDGTRFYVLGAREEGGLIELVGMAETSEEAAEMANSIIQVKGWVYAFVGMHLTEIMVNLSKVEQRKHGDGYYFKNRRND